MDKRPLISVIVPVYGTEKYLRKCLDSILNQTYKEIELIVVNDASKDKSEDIIMEYMRMDERVKYVRHSKNRGLFQARISGAEEATGEYIAFVDSDDYISCDFYRMLVKKAEETGADMVLADFCQEYEDGRREYYNLDPVRLQDLDLHGDDVLKTFMEQKGLFFSWQLAWNKLIRKELWVKCEADYMELSEKVGHLIMTEDIAFSSCWWIKASHVTNVHNVSYFYCKRAGQSTDNVSESKLKKNLQDTIQVFDFFEDTLKRNNKLNLFKNELDEWRKLYGRINCDIFVSSNLIDEYGGIIQKEFFGDCGLSGMTYEDNFFYSIKTEVAEAYEWYEDIKRGIISSSCEYVSFDIFDTLICRPFWQPTDLFYLMNDKFMKLTGATSNIDFAQMRIESERYCREEARVKYPAFDDITLTEIYETMGEIYYIPKEVCQKLKEMECEYEIQFCVSRRTGHELYDLAQYLGKKIVIASDMYLERDVIENILQKNGYMGYEKLYLSSEIRLGKWSGKLFKHLVKDIGCSEASNIIHIGDNWGSDVEKPREFGMRSFHLEKPVAIMENLNAGIYSGEAFTQPFVNNATGRDLNGGIWGFFGLRTMLACVANKFFDQPYVSFNKASDFNADPSFIGYYALGMHVLGVTNWIINEIKNKNNRSIHFVARDGYLVKKVYDILSEGRNLPNSNYLYLSRKALALADINSPIDLYSLINKLNIFNCTPAKFLAMFSGMIEKDALEEFEQNLLNNGFLVKTKFLSRKEYEKFVKHFINNLWDKISWEGYREILFDYFSNIIENGDMLFDIGYSGRSESALKNVLGFSMDSLYIHSNSDVLHSRETQNGFKNKQFFDYKPYITGVMREHVFMQLAPSTIGYEKKEIGKIGPVFEDYENDFATEFITNMVQNAAITFVKDLRSLFGENMDALHVRKQDISQPFEYYLHYAKKIDRNIFATLIFEDGFGEGKKLRAVDFWSKEIERMMNLQKTITRENRTICENEYIGVVEKKIVRLKDTGKKEGLNERKTAIFLDEIQEGDSQEVCFSKCAGNTSNLVFWEAISRKIAPKTIPNWYMTHLGGFDENEYDVFLTTNLVWLQEGQDITYLNDVLNRIGDKVLLPIGIGLSAEREKTDFYLTPESVSVLKKIAERCKSVGVRGEYTAEILSKYGIKNSMIIGCPSMYTKFPALRERIESDEIKNIIATFRPFYGTFSKQEIELLSWFEKNKCSLVDTTVLGLSTEHVVEEDLFQRLKAFEEKKEVYFSVSSWRDSFKNADFAMGMNFHNNVLAMQMGVPALFVTHETSTREMCRYFELPSIDVTEFDEFRSVQEYYQMADYAKFKQSIGKHYSTYVKFLKENGVALNEYEIIEK